jgi:arsenite methyltransferase
VGYFVFRSGRPELAGDLLNGGLWPRLSWLAAAILMRWGSRVGKLRLRDRLLDTVAWRGDEQVLDAGCGHGLLLLGAARHLTSGRAIGIDRLSLDCSDEMS